MMEENYDISENGLAHSDDEPIRPADLEVSDCESDAEDNDGIPADAMDEYAADSSDSDTDEQPRNTRSGADKVKIAQEDRKRKRRQAEKERKKMKMEEKLEKFQLTNYSAKSQHQLWSEYYKHHTLKMKLSKLEEKLLSDSNFFDCGDLHVEKDDFPSILKTVIPNLAGILVPKRPEVSKASLRKYGPLVLIICSSGMRCMQVIRALRPLTDNQSTSLKIAKLFAKHFKVEEQVQYLSQHAVHVGVGTPNRIMKLLQDGALKVMNCRAIVLDAGYCDSKKQTLLTSRESSQDFFDLFTNHLHALCTQHITSWPADRPSVVPASDSESSSDDKEKSSVGATTCNTKNLSKKEKRAQRLQARQEKKERKLRKLGPPRMFIY